MLVQYSWTINAIMMRNHWSMWPEKTICWNNYIVYGLAPLVLFYNIIILANKKNWFVYDWFLQRWREFRKVLEIGGTKAWNFVKKERKWWLVILGEKGRRGSRERREMMLRCGGYTIISWNETNLEVIIFCAPHTRKFTITYA